MMPLVPPKKESIVKKLKMMNCVGLAYQQQMDASPGADSDYCKSYGLPSG